MEIWACIPPTLCCIYNIIQYYDPDEFEDHEAEEALAETLTGVSANQLAIYGPTAEGFITAHKQDIMMAKRDEIAESHWQDHLNYLHSTVP